MCDAKTLITGVADGVGIKGMIYDPLNLSGTAGRKPKKPKIDAPSPDVERARAEAEATQRVNAQLAADQRRRRGQESLIARGAPQPTFGDMSSLPEQPGVSTTTPGRATSRSAVGRTASLMSRGVGSMSAPGRQPKVSF